MASSEAPGRRLVTAATAFCRAPFTLAAALAAVEGFFAVPRFAVDREAAARAAFRLRAAFAIRFRLVAAAFRLPAFGFPLPAARFRLPAPCFPRVAPRVTRPAPRALVFFLATVPPRRRLYARP